MPMTPTGIAQAIREKVQDINDLLILAALAELDVEFICDARNWDEALPANLRVWVSQEVR